MFGRFMIAAALLVVSGVGTLFVVADLSRLQFDLQVTVEDAAAVEIGAAVEFVPDAGVATSGTVARIDPEADPRTHLVHIAVKVADPKGRLRPQVGGLGRIRRASGLQTE